MVRLLIPCVYNKRENTYEILLKLFWKSLQNKKVNHIASGIQLHTDWIYVWYFRFDIRPDGSLIVQNVTVEDEGTFLCVADNGIERVSAGARLIIRRSIRDEIVEPKTSAYQTGWFFVCTVHKI